LWPMRRSMNIGESPQAPSEPQPIDTVDATLAPVLNRNKMPEIPDWRSVRNQFSEDDCDDETSVLAQRVEQIEKKLNQFSTDMDSKMDRMAKLLDSFQSTFESQKKALERLKNEQTADRQSNFLDRLIGTHDDVTNGGTREHRKSHRKSARHSKFTTTTQGERSSVSLSPVRKGEESIMDVLAKDERFKDALCQKRYYKHAATFCPYPNPFPQIDHLDYDPYQTLEKVHGCRYARAWIYHFMHNQSFISAAEQFECIILFLIVVSTASYICSTVEEWSHPIWEGIEIFVSVTFTVEYVLRLISVKNVCYYLTSPLNFVDLIAIVPWYIEKACGVDGVGLRILRIVRLVRIIRLRAMMDDWTEILADTIKKSFLSANMTVTLLLCLFELVIFSSIMYTCERDADSGFDNIPISMYWCMVTISTVGYGDMVPVTGLGKLCACFTVFTGLLIVASVIITFVGNFEISQRQYFEQKRKFKQMRKEKRKSLAVLNPSSEPKKSITASSPGTPSAEATGRLSFGRTSQLFLNTSKESILASLGGRNSNIEMLKKSVE